MNQSETERWADVVGYEGLYRVSEGGAVMTVGKGRGRHVRAFGSVVPQIPNANGYASVRLSVDGKRTRHTVHKIVTRAFLGPLPTGLQVRHEDGDRMNAALSNLSYGTAKDNADDRERHGTTPRGTKVGTSVLDPTKVTMMRELRSAGVSQREVARRMGVSKGTIHNVDKLIYWRHV